MIDFIQRHIPETEALAQLAEEAAELAQAALKLRRAIDGENPTPVRLSEAWSNLQEEIADVLLCLQVVGVDTTPSAYQRTIDRKLERWVSRLRSASSGVLCEDRTESGLADE